MEMQEIFEETTRYFLRPIVPLLDDPDVSEILINGYRNIYFEKAGRIQKSEDIRFESAESLTAAAQNIAQYVNRNIGGDFHSMDARLPDGSRVHIIVPPCARFAIETKDENGETNREVEGSTCVSIRKFKKASFNLEQLIAWNSMSPIAAEFLDIAVKAHKNIVIAGGTGTGKTSMLNALSSAIAPDERIVVIEDSSELQLNQHHVVYLEAQPPKPDGTGQVTIRDLFVDSLRMRPDRIVVGEIRRGEALDLIQSMISGHAGSLTTVHATTAVDAAIRLETLSLMSDVSLPVHVARTQVASAIHLVVQISRFSDGSRKVRAISECLGLDKDGNYRFQDLFVLNLEQGEGGKFVGQLNPTGIKPTFAQEIYSYGLGHHVKLTKDIYRPPPESPT